MLIDWSLYGIPIIAPVDLFHAQDALTENISKPSGKVIVTVKMQLTVHRKVVLINISINKQLEL